MSQQRRQRKKGQPINSVHNAMIAIERTGSLLSKAQDRVRKKDDAAAKEFFVEAADRLHEASEYLQRHVRSLR